MAKKPRRRGFFFYSSIFIIFLFFGAALGALSGYIKSAPALDEIQFDPMLTTYIYDADGKVLTRLWRQNRVPVKLDQIPYYLRAATIAIEDHRFYHHHGFDPIRIVGALIQDIKSGRIVAGGSTITQQLAKNAFFTHDRVWSRKLKELLWAIQIERKYSKDEILEAYLNTIYYGHGAYGVEAAAETYFGKHVWELDLAEAALLAGIPNGPGYFSPFVDMDAAYRRRNTVLYRMWELGYITESEYQEAKNTPIEVVERKQPERIATYFIEWIIGELIQRYGEEKVLAGGLRIYTTIDRDMQIAAEKVISEGLPTARVDSRGIPQPQGALVAIDPHTGYIKAMVGGRGEGNDKFNRAVYALRQPGSAIKPFLYTVALQKGFTPATIVVDEPLEYEMPDGSVWQVRNYNRDYQGQMTLRRAVELSSNVVAVKVLEQVGIKDVIELAKKMGITTLVETGPYNDVGLAPMALGGLTRGVSPLEMAAAFAVYANQGIRVEPIAITKVVDAYGNVLEENKPKRQVVLDEEVAYMMTDLLRGVIERGTGRQANIGRPAAGKTGTSDDWTNGWFIGYTPDLVTAVWIGNDNQSERMVYNGVRYGSWNAAQLWANFMRQALAGMPISNFPKPAGILEGVLIDTKTGLLAKENAGIPVEDLAYETFIAGTEPTEWSPRIVTSPVDKARNFFQGVWNQFMGGFDNKKSRPQDEEGPSGLGSDWEKENPPQSSETTDGEMSLPEGYYHYLEGDI